MLLHPTTPTGLSRRSHPGKQKKHLLQMHAGCQARSRGADSSRWLSLGYLADRRESCGPSPGLFLYRFSQLRAVPRTFFGRHFAFSANLKGVVKELEDGDRPALQPGRAILPQVHGAGARLSKQGVPPNNAEGPDIAVFADQNSDPNGSLDPSLLGSLRVPNPNSVYWFRLVECDTRPNQLRAEIAGLFQDLKPANESESPVRMHKETKH